MNNCVEKKKDIVLKDYDNSLVGYWDMETLSWSMLKDLSWNGNDWAFSWGMTYATALTWWIVWKWLNFNWSSNYIEILDSNYTWSVLKPKDFTLITNIKLTNYTTYNFYHILQSWTNWNDGKWYVMRIYKPFNYFNAVIFTWISNQNKSIDISWFTESKNYNFIVSKKELDISMYLDWKLIWQKK